MVIVVAVFYPILGMLSTGLFASNDLRGSNTAVILAQKKLEEVKGTSFSSISSEAKGAVTNYPGYSRQVLVAATYTSLKDIAVIVYWLPGKGTESSISVETFIANY